MLNWDALCPMTLADDKCTVGMTMINNLIIIGNESLFSHCWIVSARWAWTALADRCHSLRCNLGLLAVDVGWVKLLPAALPTNARIASRRRIATTRGN